MSSSGRRFAIYYAPDDGRPLARTAAAWLGWDALSGSAPTTPHTNGLPFETWRGVTDSPRIYGFHATLKPPFRLVPDITQHAIFNRFEQFAASQNAFEAPRLQLSALGNFLALTLSEPSLKFEALAAAAVVEFDQFRAAPPSEEVARRKKASLNARQLELLTRWGYPYVMDEWRFHMTLTGSLGPALRDELMTHLTPLFAPLCAEPFRVDSICLFEQPDSDAPFRCVRRAALA